MELQRIDEYLDRHDDGIRRANRRALAVLERAPPSKLRRSVPSGQRVQPLCPGCSLTPTTRVAGVFQDSGTTSDTQCRLLNNTMACNGSIAWVRNESAR